MRHACVFGGTGEINDAICRRLAKLDYETTVACIDIPSGSLALPQSAIGESKEHRIDVCISHVDMPFALIEDLAEAMAQGDWGRIVLIEWLDDYAADTEAERANKEGSFAKLASKLASRGVTINTIVTVKGNVEDGEDFSQSGRLSKYEEIAGLTAYLVTDEAGFLSGARIAFDVGRRLA